MTQIRLEADSYTLRVLDVIKGKYGLKNRSEALKKFAREFGEEFVEPEMSDTYVQMLREQVEEYEKNPSKFKKFSIDNVDTLWEG